MTPLGEQKGLVRDNVGRVERALGARGFGRPNCLKSVALVEGALHSHFHLRVFFKFQVVGVFKNSKLAGLGLLIGQLLFRLDVAGVSVVVYRVSTNTRVQNGELAEEELVAVDFVADFHGVVVDLHHLNVVRLEQVPDHFEVLPNLRVAGRPHHSLQK